VIEGKRSVHGIGIGLRQAIAEPLFEAEQLPPLAFVEIHPENYVRRGGRFRGMLERAQARWPILTHGLTLGLGAVEPADPSYVAALKRLLTQLNAPWHSEHLCFSGVDGVMTHDLLPLPFRHETVRVVVARVRELQDALERPVAIENISYYAHPGVAEMDEAQFLLEVLEGCDAKLLLDVNNVYVNSRNHGFDPLKFLERMPAERIVQLHVAGHSQRTVRGSAAGARQLLIDTHGAALRDEVYELLGHVLARVGPVPVLLERDQNFPPFQELCAELQRLHQLYSCSIGASWA